MRPTARGNSEMMVRAMFCLGALVGASAAPIGTRIDERADILASVHANIFGPDQGEHCGTFWKNCVGVNVRSALSSATQDEKCDALVEHARHLACACLAHRFAQNA